MNTQTMHLTNGCPHFLGATILDSGLTDLFQISLGCDCEGFLSREKNHENSGPTQREGWQGSWNLDRVL